MNRIRTLVTVVVMMVALVPQPSAATPALDFVEGVTFGTRDTFTAGWAFTVNSPVTVDALGLFDVDGDGFLQNHQISLWTAGGTLLDFTVITNANSTPVASTSSFGNWRFTSIAPLVLTAGEYVIGAVYAFANATNSTVDAFVFNATASTVPEVTFGENRFLGGIGFPSDSVDANDGLFGPNLSVTAAAAVAEPASLVLLGTGLAGLTGMAAWRLRRRR